MVYDRAVDLFADDGVCGMRRLSRRQRYCSPRKPLSLSLRLCVCVEREREREREREIDRYTHTYIHAYNITLHMSRWATQRGRSLWGYTATTGRSPSRACLGCGSARRPLPSSSPSWVSIFVSIHTHTYRGCAVVCPHVHTHTCRRCGNIDGHNNTCIHMHTHTYTCKQAQCSHRSSSTSWQAYWYRSSRPHTLVAQGLIH